MDGYAKRFTAKAGAYWAGEGKMKASKDYVPDNATLERELVLYLLSVSSLQFQFSDGSCFSRRFAYYSCLELSGADRCSTLPPPDPVQEFRSIRGDEAYGVEGLSKDDQDAVDLTKLLSALQTGAPRQSRGRTVCYLMPIESRG